MSYSTFGNKIETKSCQEMTLLTNAVKWGEKYKSVLKFLSQIRQIIEHCFNILNSQIKP